MKPTFFCHPFGVVEGIVIMKMK